MTGASDGPGDRSSGRPVLPVPGFLIHEAVVHHARVSPNRPAMAISGQTMTYGDLDRQSAQVAHCLLAAGLERSSRVGIFMRKGLPLGPAIYGTLRAGGAFVPLDPGLPPERLAFLIADCGIHVVISNDAQAETLRALPADCRPLVVGTTVDLPMKAITPGDLAAFPVVPPESVWITDQDLAYIMYTSGSTGSPKGMMHTHRGCLAYARWGAAHVGLGPGDRVASHAPLHFDLSIFDFFSTSQVGAAVVLVPEVVTKFPASWTETVEKERISVVFTVPFTLMEMERRGALASRDLACLRWILFGGEPYPPHELRALMRALPETRFSNVYGPAEAPSCTVYDVPVDYPQGDGAEPLPIGHVSVGSDGLILDDDGVQAAAGEPGELCIRSTTLTRGYWNRPDLNARAFLVRPSYAPDGEVYYRTGDVVRERPDGLLEFLGRRDRMVKTRGHRVELDEVEAALSSHPNVAEAAAFTRPDDQGSRSIHGAVRLAEGRSETSAALRSFARTKLPTYAVPVSIAILNELPRTTTGKVDRGSLAAADPADS